MLSGAGEYGWAARGGLPPLRGNAAGRKGYGMSAQTVNTQFLTVEEYLASEPLSEVKREYLAGMVYDMAGAGEAHNVIAMNLYAMLHTRLRGRPCQPFGSDMQARLRRPAGFYHYYPDAMIACDPTDSPGCRWRERPAALFEILSESTRRTDEREKRLAYLELPSLQAYVRIDPDRPEVVMDVRTAATEDWRMEHCRGLAAVVKLPALGMELPLAELYERLVFPED